MLKDQFLVDDGVDEDSSFLRDQPPAHPQALNSDHQMTARIFVSGISRLYSWNIWHIPGITWGVHK